MGCKKLCLSVALLPYLIIFEHVRAQCTQPSFASRNVVMSDLSTQNFPDGSTVTFQCEIGHKPVNSRASKTVTCEGTQWTSLEFECTKKSCGSPPDLTNGKWEKTGILFGDTITAVCNKGYILDGMVQGRVCRDRGWDKRNPECQAVKCVPPKVENGQIKEDILEEYEYSHVISFKCNSGLSLIGNSTLHCTEDGTFKPNPPKCLDVCLNPNVLNSIRIDGKPPPYELKNFIKYKCKDGFIMKGDAHIVCSENGWIPEPPQCIALPTTTTTARTVTSDASPTDNDKAHYVINKNVLGGVLGVVLLIIAIACCICCYRKFCGSSSFKLAGVDNSVV